MIALIDELLTEAEAAVKLGMSTRTFKGYVDEGRIIPIPIGRGLKRQTRRYDPADVETLKRKLQEAEAERRERCRYAKTPARGSTPTSSRSEVYDFMALRNERMNAKR